MYLSPASLAWSLNRLYEIEDPQLPPNSTRLSLTRRFLELALFSPALLLLQGILAADDEEMDAWYLQGWCLYLMAQQVKEGVEKVEDLGWEDLSLDSRDCLDTYLVVSYPLTRCRSRLNLLTLASQSTRG